MIRHRADHRLRHSVSSGPLGVFSEFRTSRLLEGSVHRSPDGAGWGAMIELPLGPNGKRVRRKRRARTKTEATTILRQLSLEAMQHGGVGDGQRLVRATMADYLRLREAEDLADKAKDMAGKVPGGEGVADKIDDATDKIDDVTDKLPGGD